MVDETNLAPTTAKQLALYSAFNKHGVEWVLVGALAYYFNGRLRGTVDIDFLMKDTIRNMVRVKRAMLELGYNFHRAKPWDFKIHKRLRVVDHAVVDIHSEFCKTRYEEVQWRVEEWEGVKIHVATRESCIMMMERETKYSADLEVLRLMEDPEKNWDELAKWQ